MGPLVGGLGPFALPNTVPPKHGPAMPFKDQAAKREYQRKRRAAMTGAEKEEARVKENARKRKKYRDDEEYREKNRAGQEPRLLPAPTTCLTKSSGS